MLLLVSLAWGLGYCVPGVLRIPFAEVFPPAVERWSFISMRGWGVILLVFAVLAIWAEQLSLRGQKWAAHLLFMAHAMLAGTYTALAAGALYTGLLEAHWQVPGLLSSASRPLLWLLIAWLHTTYARLPTPPQERSEPAPPTRWRFMTRVPIDD